MAEVILDYTNHRGERSLRKVDAQAIRRGISPYHEGEQLLVEAFDLDKGLDRTFALRDVHRWQPVGANMWWGPDRLAEFISGSPSVRTDSDSLRFYDVPPWDATA
jgi:hypothetical protein